MIRWMEPCMFPLCSAAVQRVSIRGPLLDQRFCRGGLVPGDEEQACDIRLFSQPLRCVLCPRSQGLQGFCRCICRCHLQSQPQLGYQTSPTQCVSVVERQTSRETCLIRVWCFNFTAGKSCPMIAPTPSSELFRMLYLTTHSW